MINEMYEHESWDHLDRPSSNFKVAPLSHTQFVIIFNFWFVVILSHSPFHKDLKKWAIDGGSFHTWRKMSE